MRNGDKVTIDIFGCMTDVGVLCTGDNQFDEEGNYKEEEYFELLPEEAECIQWLVNCVKLSDYKREILDYCNEQYEMIAGGEITEDDLAGEIHIDTIAINISEITQSKDGTVVYPEVSFCGSCNCDPEHGICIGFRDRKFLGVNSFDWTL